MRGTKKKSETPRMTAGDYLVHEYVADTYKTESPEILALLKGHLSRRERGDLRWHITVVTGAKALVISDHPEEIKKVLVLGPDGRKKALFKAES